MVLTTNGKNYIAREFGINNCYVATGLIWKAVKLDNSTVAGTGDTANLVNMLIQTNIYTRIDLTVPKVKSYTYSELKQANDNLDVVNLDAQWIALNDGYITPDQYCDTTTTPSILTSMYTRPSQNPSFPASEGYIETVSTGSGAGTLTYYRDGISLGSKYINIPGAWTDIDDFGGPAVGFGTWTYSVSDGVNTFYSTITLNPPCPALSASVSITPTTIVSGGSITYTSTAIGGVANEDGFGHEILIDGVTVYNTGLRKAAIISGTLQITGILPGSHAVTSRITDGCLPAHQVATSPPKTLTVSPIACPTLVTTLAME